MVVFTFRKKRQCFHCCQFLINTVVSVHVVEFWYVRTALIKIDCWHSIQRQMHCPFLKIYFNYILLNVIYFIFNHTNVLLNRSYYKTIIIFYICLLLKGSKQCHNLDLRMLIWNCVFTVAVTKPATLSSIYKPDYQKPSNAVDNVIDWTSGLVRPLYMTSNKLPSSTNRIIMVYIHKHIICS